MTKYVCVYFHFFRLGQPLIWCCKFWMVRYLSCSYFYGILYTYKFTIVILWWDFPLTTSKLFFQMSQTPRVSKVHLWSVVFLPLRGKTSKAIHQNGLYAAHLHHLEIALLSLQYQYRYCMSYFSADLLHAQMKQLEILQTVSCGSTFWMIPLGYSPIQLYVPYTMATETATHSLRARLQRSKYSSVLGSSYGIVTSSSVLFLARPWHIMLA